MADKFEFELGQEVKDKITGFTGIVGGRAQFLTGCNRYDIKSKKLDKDGMPLNDIWFDENQIVATKGKSISIEKKEGKPLGGPTLSGQIPTSKDPK